MLRHGLLVAAALLAATGTARADMGEVTVANWQGNETAITVIPGPLCTLFGSHERAQVAVGKTASLDCDPVLRQHKPVVTLFLVEPNDDDTLVCSVRWDDAGIFTVEAGLKCRYGESTAADVTVFEAR